MKIFLLPYAGGSSLFFGKWRDADIEFIPVEYKGHGARIDECLCDSIPEVAKDVFQVIQEKASQEEYSVFGHSMGGLVAYELYNEIIRNGFHEPVNIYISGCRAPSCPTRENISELTGEEYKKAVMELGGVTDSFFNEVVYRIFNPILHKDFQINEEYECESTVKFNCPLIILNGKQDPSINSVEVNEWKNFGSNTCDFHYFEGNHFYLNNYTDVIGVIKQYALAI